MNTKAKGYAFAAIAAATYGMLPLFTLPLYADGMNTNSVLLLRYVFAILIMGAMVPSKGGHFRLPRSQILPILSMDILMSLSSIFLFTSYIYMDASIASTMLFVYPLFVAVIMAIAFREKLSWLVYLCMLVAIFGIFLLYKTSDGATLSLVGTLFVMASALSYAAYIVGANLPMMRTIPTVKITFYVLLFGISVFIVRCFCGAELTLPSTWWLWLDIVALALFPTAISFLCATTATQCIGSTPTAILGAIEPITAILIGVSVFAERLTPRDCLGIFLIIFAVTCVVAEGLLLSYLKKLWKVLTKKAE